MGGGVLGIFEGLSNKNGGKFGFSSVFYVGNSSDWWEVGFLYKIFRQ